jgi:hypothetical protein
LKSNVLAEEVQFLELYFEVLGGSGSNANVICICMVIVGENSGVGLWGWYDGLYPLLPTASHLKRGSIKIVKRKGKSVSPWRVSLYEKKKYLRKYVRGLRKRPTYALPSKKDRNSFQEGHVKGIGSSMDIQPYKGGMCIDFKGH